MHIAILTNYNLYESKRYFSLKLAEALRRLGAKVTIIDFKTVDKQADEFRRTFTRETTFTCSFNSMIPSQGGKLPCDYTGVPHLFFLVDPAINSRNILNNKNLIITCVDYFDCEYLYHQNFHRTFFWPHAVERELSSSYKERPYDVVFLGTCYDHETLRNYWQMNLNPKDVQVIESAVDIVLGDNETPLYKAVKTSLIDHGLGLEEGDEFEKRIKFYLDFVDNYVRGKDRTELIRSIKNAHVHVFGDISWRSNSHT